MDPKSVSPCSEKSQWAEVVVEGGAVTRESGDRRSVSSQPCCPRTQWPSASSFPSLGLSLLICKMGNRHCLPCG